MMGSFKNAGSKLWDVSSSIPIHTTNVMKRSRSLNHNEWEQVGQTITGEGRLDLSGEAVALSEDGSILAIGAVDNDGNSTSADNNQGHVRVYTYESISALWTQLGTDIDGVFAQDKFGHALALSGNGLILAVGAPSHDNPQDDIGRVRVYEFQLSQNDWVQIGDDILGTNLGDRNGFSVTLDYDGNNLAVGAPDSDANGEDSGYVRTFYYDRGGTDNWEQVGNDILGEATADRSGYAVSFSRSGERLAVGAIFNDGINGVNSGHVRVHEWNSTSGDWDKIGNDIDGGFHDDQSGFSVSLNGPGDVVAIGSPQNNEGTGLLEIYEFDGTEWQARTSGGPIIGSGEIQTVKDYLKFLSVCSLINILTPPIVTIHSFIRLHRQLWSFCLHF